MKRVLVTYATFAGSTVEVARAVGEEFSSLGLESVVLPIAEVGDLESYDAVIVGAPMILGWHRDAIGFLKRHRRKLAQIPIAAFVMAMSLTQSGEREVNGVPIFVDERLPKPPAKEGHLSIRERYAQLANYVRPIIRGTRPRKPVSIGVFAGRLEYGRMPPWAVVFVMVLLHAAAGDRRDWTAIRSWARILPEKLGLMGSLSDVPRS